MARLTPRSVPLIVAGLLLVPSACSDDASGDQSSGDETASAEAAEPQLVDPATFAELAADEDVIVIDVRTPEEYAAGRIGDPLLIDWNAGGFEDGVDGLERDRRYLVYCRSGNRSANAVATMRSLGFTDIVELDGGIAAWADAGLPVDS